MVPLASLAGAPRAGLRDGNPERPRRERLCDRCNVSLPIGSPLAGFNVRTLPAVAPIGQSRFACFADRQATPGCAAGGGG
ncbi:conserved hypothetical protein (plasmid) [Ralstonia solanacearum Po82]|uniref:Uncharacterized protein n=1 Tax=Ralstonia solanacearum (strain Po82) TaxID=1031711 RepID=F6G971_RALS8|nr:conserved hypothetical protein [Ralstonia solanacearum Po82]